MAVPTTPPPRKDTSHDDDAALSRESRDRVARAPALQLVAELLTILRSLELEWWTPEDLRRRWGADIRMSWLRDRADLRQRITTQLTGLHRNAARKHPPELQAAIIDAAIDEGDVTVDAFDAAFTPLDLAAYGPADELWREFRSRMPWRNDGPHNRELVGRLLRAIVSRAPTVEGLPARRPILTPFELRAAIDPSVWQRCLPVDLRASIDAARLQHERARPDALFRAEHELAIATPELLARHLPLAQLAPIVDLAERRLGFATPLPLVAPRADATNPSAASAKHSDSMPVAAPDPAAAEDEDDEGPTPRCIPRPLVESRAPIPLPPHPARPVGHARSSSPPAEGPRGTARNSSVPPPAVRDPREAAGATGGRGSPKRVVAYYAPSAPGASAPPSSDDLEDTRNR